MMQNPRAVDEIEAIAVEREIKHGTFTKLDAVEGMLLRVMAGLCQRFRREIESDDVRPPGGKPAGVLAGAAPGVQNPPVGVVLRAHPTRVKPEFHSLVGEVELVPVPGRRMGTVHLHEAGIPVFQPRSVLLLCCRHG
jgi:hypothetical protein